MAILRLICPRNAPGRSVVPGGLVRWLVAMFTVRLLKTGQYRPRRSHLVQASRHPQLRLWSPP
jgi:hypothetical protein